VSLDRLTDFMQNTELLDFMQPLSEQAHHDIVNEPPPGVIGFHNADFVWSRNHAADSQAFTLRIKGELQFKQGGFNLIIGPT